MGAISAIVSILSGIWSILWSGFSTIIAGLIKVYNMAATKTGNPLLAGAVTLAILGLSIAAVGLAIRITKSFVLLIVVLIVLGALIFMFLV